MFLKICAALALTLPVTGLESIVISAQGDTLPQEARGHVVRKVHRIVQRSTSSSKIIIVGDSNARFAGPSPMEPVQPLNTLQQNCAGSTVVNKGDIGTTTAHWNKDNGTEYTKALGSGSGWTHAWVSLGANDMAMPDLNCSGKAELKRRLAASIGYLKALAPGIKIVLTGYAIPATSESCTTEQYNSSLYSSMQELNDADPLVTFVSIAEVTGAKIAAADRVGCSASSQGPPCKGNPKWFTDDFIHLNPLGFAEAWKLPAIQRAFGCGSSNALTNAPTQAPSQTSCQDDNQGISDEAKGAGFPWVTGCNDVRSFGCEGTHEHGARIRARCCCPGPGPGGTRTPVPTER